MADAAAAMGVEQQGAALIKGLEEMQQRQHDYMLLVQVVQCLQLNIFEAILQKAGDRTSAVGSRLTWKTAALPGAAVAEWHDLPRA